MAATVSPLLCPPLLFGRRRSLPPHASAAASTCRIEASQTSALSSKKKVLVPVAFGTEEMEAVILAGVLRRAGADVTLASVEKGLEIQCSSKTRLLADTFIDTCVNDTFDLVALPGGMPGAARLRDCEVLEKITRRQAGEERLYGAIGVAPAVVLQTWNLTTGRKLTCHPAFTDSFSPAWTVEKNVQVSHGLTTSRGPGTAYEFALSFVQQLFGTELARSIKKELYMETNSVNGRQEFNKTEWSVNRLPPRVLVPIANGCEEMEVVTIVDILRRVRVKVVVASVDTTVQVVACQKTQIIADLLIDAVKDQIFDVIVLPGGEAGAKQLQKSKVLMKLLREHKSEGRIYGAIWPSTQVLHEEGLLVDNRVIASADMIGKLGSPVTAKSGVVIDGKLITCIGFSMTALFSMTIVNKLYDQNVELALYLGLGLHVEED